MLNVNKLNIKFKKALKERSFPKDLSEEERRYVNYLVKTEKEQVLDCSINPSNKYLTCRTEAPDDWHRLQALMTRTVEVCDCCKKEEAIELHEVWSYVKKDNTCYKTLSDIKHLCTHCHTLCHTVRYMNYLNTNSYIVNDYSIRTVSNKYADKDKYEKLHTELSEKCPALSPEQWSTLHLYKNCLSNYYRRTCDNFEIDMTYLYKLIDKLERN